MRGGREHCRRYRRQWQDPGCRTEKAPAVGVYLCEVAHCRTTDTETGLRPSQLVGGDVAFLVRVTAGWIYAAAATHGQAA